MQKKVDLSFFVSIIFVIRQAGFNFTESIYLFSRSDRALQFTFSFVCS